MHLHRRPHKIRRTGRHTTPSQVEKVAETAVKVAPAVAITGALVALPAAANAAVRTPAKATAVREQVQQAQTTAVRHATQSVTTTYTVRSGDTLSLISQHFYGTTSKWNWIYEANRAKISNPDSIFVGERLTIPNHAPVATAYSAKHAKKAPTVLTSSTSRLSGNLSCSGLEALWETAGGSHGEAFMAAEIAMAESDGHQYAHSPTNDFGYWQINGVHGPAMATYDPLGNARAAIAISDDGNNWGAWTTYTSGAYQGRC
ncbi:MAG: LysM peptidoglycan-binding domain-containing protein [Streptosporangiaceae bacterium]|jgi:LysM repeat protein